jgi:hypothetical protein
VHTRHIPIYRRTFDGATLYLRLKKVT